MVASCAAFSAASSAARSRTATIFTTEDFGVLNPTVSASTSVAVVAYATTVTGPTDGAVNLKSTEPKSVRVAPVVPVVAARAAPFAIAVRPLPEILFPKTSNAVAVSVTAVPAAAESTPASVIELIFPTVPWT